MLNNTLVSVIVPVYNAEAYLEKCIDSILAQTFKRLEVVIVNDGSSDNSRIIIEQYAATDERIIFIDGPNEGVSAARNKGLDQASGEFITFVDADDWIEPDMYESLVGEACNNNADWVICDVIVEKNLAERRKRLNLLNETVEVSVDPKSAMSNLMRFKYDNANWNKLYRRSIIEENLLRFEPKMGVGEDLLFNCCYILFVSRLQLIGAAFYHYRISEGSIMGKSKYDEVEEYKKLCEGFHTFSSELHCESVYVFDCEMRRGYYYAMIPFMLSKIRKQTSNKEERRNRLVVKLRNTHYKMFDYDTKEMKGIQGIKKLFLKKGYFKTFALLAFRNG